MNKFQNWVCWQFNRNNNNDFDIETVYRMMIDLNNRKIDQNDFNRRYEGFDYIYKNFKKGMKKGSLPFNQQDVDYETNCINLFMFVRTGMSLNYFNSPQNQYEDRSRDYSDYSYSNHPYRKEENYNNQYFEEEEEEAEFNDNAPIEGEVINKTKTFDNTLSDGAENIGNNENIEYKDNNEYNDNNENDINEDNNDNDNNENIFNDNIFDYSRLSCDDIDFLGGNFVNDPEFFDDRYDDYDYNIDTSFTPILYETQNDCVNMGKEKGYKEKEQDDKEKEQDDKEKEQDDEEKEQDDEEKEQDYEGRRNTKIKTKTTFKKRKKKHLVQSLDDDMEAQMPTKEIGENQTTDETTKTDEIEKEKVTKGKEKEHKVDKIENKENVTKGERIENKESIVKKEEKEKKEKEEKEKKEKEEKEKKEKEEKEKKEKEEKEKKEKEEKEKKEKEKKEKEEKEKKDKSETKEEKSTGKGVNEKERKIAPSKETTVEIEYTENKDGKVQVLLPQSVKDKISKKTTLKDSPIDIEYTQEGSKISVIVHTEASKASKSKTTHYPNYYSGSGSYSTSKEDEKEESKITAPRKETTVEIEYTEDKDGKVQVILPQSVKDKISKKTTLKEKPIDIKYTQEGSKISVIVPPEVAKRCMAKRYPDHIKCVTIITTYRGKKPIKRRIKI